MIQAKAIIFNHAICKLDGWKISHLWNRSNVSYFKGNSRLRSFPDNYLEAIQPSGKTFLGFYPWNAFVLLNLWVNSIEKNLFKFTSGWFCSQTIIYPFVEIVMYIVHKCTTCMRTKNYSKLEINKKNLTKKIKNQNKDKSDYSCSMSVVYMCMYIST